MAVVEILITDCLLPVFHLLWTHN